MPEPKTGEFMDLKTILLVAALGGTNALQYLGIAAPAQTHSAETTANAEFIRDELHICIKELKECNRHCSRSDTIDDPSEEFPFSNDFAK